MRSVFIFDWIQLKRSGSFIILTLLLLFLGLYAGIYGRVITKDQQSKIDYLESKINGGMQQIKNAIHEKDTVAWEYDPILKTIFSNSPDGIAALSPGQRDLHKFVLEISEGTYYYNKYATGYTNKTLSSEIVNPEKQAAGHLDINFIIVFILPLYFILISYNVLSSEKENGTFTLLEIQSSNGNLIIVYKLMLRFVISGILALAIIASAAFINHALPDSRWLLFASAAIAYLLFWLGIVTIIIAALRSSGFNALTLISCWLFLCVVLPATFNAILNARNPVDSKNELSAAVQKANSTVFAMKRREVADSFYKFHPSYNNIPNDTVGGSWYNPRWMRAVHGMLDKKVEPYEYAYHEKLAKRIEQEDNLTYISPPLLIQQVYNEVAGSDMRNMLLFDQYSYTNFNLWNNYLDERIYFSNNRFTKKDFAELPAFEFNPKINYLKISMEIVIVLTLGLISFIIGIILFKQKNSKKHMMRNDIHCRRIAAIVKRIIILIMLFPVTATMAQQSNEKATDSTTSQVKTVSLQNVTVTSTTKAIESREGKLIYNVEKSITSRGTNAFDQLRKLPGIKIDAEDNLSLKGSSAVTIMVDGKLTYLSSQQLSTYLKSLPAESLQRIELITNPSSQYDASGNAGIINIVTKKTNKTGYALIFKAGAGVGKYGQSSDGFMGNIRTKLINLFGGYTYNYNHSNLKRSSYRTITSGGETISYDRRSVDPAIANNNNFKAGMDVYLDKRTTIGAIYNGTHNRWTRNAGGPTYLLSASSTIDSIARNKNFTDEPARSNAYNINFARQLDTAGGNLNMDLDLARYNDNSIGYLDNGIYSTGGSLLQAYQSLTFQQPSIITIRSAKADINLPTRYLTWKFGAKYAWVETNNNFRYDSLLNGTYKYSPALSNHFIYDEKVSAGYISITSALNKSNSLDAGIRVEHTLSKGSLLNTGSFNKRNYTNLFPFISLTNKLSDQNEITISVSRRINRPQYSNLNPTRYFFDKYSYHEGNPLLQPETSWNGNVVYTFKQTYIATLNYSRIQNAIMGFATQDSATGVFRVADRNFSNKHTADILLVAPFKLLPFWSILTTTDLIYVNYSYNDGKGSFNPNKLNIDLQMAQTFTLPKDISAEITTFYTSPSLNGIYVLRCYFQTDIGLKKSFMKKRFDAVFTCRDLFRTDRFWAYSVYNATSIRYDHRPDTRRINLALTYKLGGKITEGKNRKLEEQERL